MKRSDERGDLLGEVLAQEGQLQTTTLAAGLDEMRRLAKRRRAVRATTAVGMPMVILATIICVRESLLSGRKEKGPSPHVARSEEVVPGTSIRVLNDEQLLELFKGRPVALVGQPGHQQLLLLDEKN